MVQKFKQTTLAEFGQQQHLDMWEARQENKKMHGSIFKFPRFL
jgi:hypothetical protein